MTPLIFNRQSFFHLVKGDEVSIEEMPYVVQKSARGGMGHILLLSRHIDCIPRGFSLGRHLAIKAILPEVAGPEELALFKRELTIWSGFRHRNIVWLLEIFDGGDAGWVAGMDWCKESLREMLDRRKRLSPDEATQILCEIINGLEYAYLKDQVLHLDLKPANILYQSLGDRYLVSD